jgi:catecholate siderophore receptor
MLPLDPTTYYGMDSDYNDGTATTGTLTHVHRFDVDSSLKIQIRQGSYTRDQRAVTVRFANATSLSDFSDSTVLRRSSKLKIQDMDTLYAQSDYQTKFQA